MPNCVKCHQPQTAAPVICRSCYRALTERTVSVDDKLIEALRCCGNRDCKKPDCDHCPLLKTHMCVKVMLESAATALEDRGAMITENAALRRTAEDDKAFPCKVGDTVYTIYSDVDGAFIEELIVTEVSTHRIWVKGKCFVYNEIGKTVFLTRGEAEAALSESSVEQ